MASNYVKSPGETRPFTKTVQAKTEERCQKPCQHHWPPSRRNASRIASLCRMERPDDIENPHNVPSPGNG